MAHSMASVLSPGALPLAELHAARLDGELFTIDERFSPVDEVETAWLRARALRSVAGTRMIAELDSALWVHGLLPVVPSIHTMCVPRSDRLKFPPSPRFVLREMTHEPGDTMEIAGLRVTVPARILHDLALVEREDVVGAARSILGRHPELAHECARRISDTPNLPGKGRALRRLEEWDVSDSQPALTRYTS